MNKTKIPLAIELKNINKRFGTVVANNNISLQIQKGTIHGIIGENGAGKSTLMNILYGLYSPDSGNILINGQPMVKGNPKDSLAMGIGMVHQHFMLIDQFSAIENIILGNEKSILLKNDLTKAKKTLLDIKNRYGISVDLEAKVAKLSIGNQQQVEILKTLYRQSQILILDEPTAVLTPQEGDQLFNILAALAKSGVTIILITHKLKEIMAITDNVTVMRSGEVVINTATPKTTIEELAKAMIGKSTTSITIHKQEYTKNLKLNVRDLCYSDWQGVQRLKHINLQLHTGEIVGIAGVSGNGQSELLEVLTGMIGFDGGSFELYHNNQTTTVTPQNLLSPKILRNLKVAHIPEDRLSTAVIKEFSAAENTILGYHTTKAYNNKLFMNNKSIIQDTKNKIIDFDVRPNNPHIPIQKFSGGNQQKLIIARELSVKPDLLIVGQPTRGVDIGAIECIHEKLISMRNCGVAILLVSVELDEIRALADRIIIMSEGKIVGEMVNNKQIDEQKIGLMMADSLSNT